VDNDAEKEMEANERMKIKLEAQLRYDRMSKSKVKGSKGNMGGSQLSGNASAQKSKKTL
jgi:hypothetical protein